MNYTIGQVQSLPRETREKIMEKLLELAFYDHQKMMDKDFLDKNLSKVAEAVVNGKEHELYPEDPDLQHFFTLPSGITLDPAMIPSFSWPDQPEVPNLPSKEYCSGKHDLVQFKGSKTVFCSECDYEEKV